MNKGKRGQVGRGRKDTRSIMVFYLYDFEWLRLL